MSEDLFSFSLIVIFLCCGYLAFISPILQSG